MKILIIRNYPSFMDVVKNTYNIQEVGLAKALVRRGNVCNILFWTDKKEKDIELSVDGYGKVYVFYRHGKTALKNTVYIGCKDLFDTYDILQTAEYNQMQSWILSKKYREKIIIYHGPYYSPFNKRYNWMCSIFDRVFLKRYLKLGTKFIVKSNMAKDFLVNKGISASNIDTLGVGIDSQMLSANDLVCEEPLYKIMRNDTNLKLLYIGRFEERRNIFFILKVLKKILKIQPNTTLYMIGSGNEKYVEAVWKRARKLGIKEHIIFQEKMEQKFLSGVYKLADFFLLPTEYEIFGMVLLEAMFYETIVITTNNGGSSMLIENGTNGFVCDSQDANEWANLITQVVIDVKKADRIKQSARKKIEKEFTWDALAGNFENIYRNIREENNP